MPGALWTACCNALVALFLTGTALAADEVVGAGSSFTALVMQAWTQQFEAGHKAAVRYRSVGSGEGIRRVTANSVDFAVTDIPLTQVELVQADLIQFPLVVGAIVPVVNLPHIAPGELHLSGAVLGDLFLGKISHWNDPALRSLNPGLELPDLPVSVVHRSDGSGTTFVFTHYLSKTNAEWQDRLGVGSRLNWPTGKGAKGNEGVTFGVQETAGAIGYVEYTYAVNNRLTTAKLLNRAGKFVAAGEISIRAALASTTWARPSYYEVVTDRAGDDSWPIVGVSFVLLHKSQGNLDDARETLTFIDWIYRDGGAAAADNHYVPLDDKGLIKRIESGWKDIKDDAGQPAWKPDSR
jgi:phosphate transport system substrate-binding protein